MVSAFYYLDWYIYGKYVVFLAVFVFAALRSALVLFTLGVVRRWNNAYHEDRYTSAIETLFMDWIFCLFLLIVSALVFTLLPINVSIESYLVASGVCIVLLTFVTYVCGKSASPMAISQIVVREGETIFGIRDFGITRGTMRTNIVIHWKSMKWKFLDNFLVIAQLVGFVSLSIIIAAYVLEVIS
jgi:hypothetical protein